MPISVDCGQCGKTYRVRDESAGKKLTCKECGATVRIPTPEADDDNLEEDYEDYEAAPPRRSSSKASKAKSKAKKTSKSSGPSALAVIGKYTGYVILGLFGLGTVIRISLFALNTANISTVRWIDYESSDKTFRVKMPGLPKMTPQNAPGVSGMTYRSEGRRFAVEIAVLKIGPNLKLPGVTEMTIAAIPKELTAKKPGSRLIRNSPIQFRQYPGTEIEVELNKERHLIRFFVIEETVYGLEFLTKLGKPAPVEEQQFFSSFDPVERRAVAASQPNAPVLGTSPGTQASSVPQAAASGNYLQRRAAFKTNLVKRGPSPQEWEPYELTADVQEISYPSSGMNLKAVIGRPSTPADPQAGGKRPALVYFHGGFAFGMDDFTVCNSFRNAGFIVMTPMLRGENGNPGHFELFFGEVDDARSAIKWLAQQPDVNPDRIYAFGHSAGGGIATMMSLFDDIPLRHCGSSGGLYPEVTFSSWADIAPFDTNNSEERKMRILLGNLNDMKRPHFAYLDMQDEITSFAELVVKGEARQNDHLKLKVIAGDHFSSLSPSFELYLQECQADLRKPLGSP